MTLHKDLTDAHLHEPKGVVSASVATVYVANGSGSGTWKKIDSASLDNTSVLNINRQLLTFGFPDIGTTGSRFLSFPRACRIDNISVVLQGNAATTDTTITFRNDAGTAMGTIVIPLASTAGAIGFLTPVTNNTFTTLTKLQVDSDGGTSTNPGLEITLDIVFT